MKYGSTRNASIVATFEEAICSGYAPDGGLFVPKELPSISQEQLSEWSMLTYPALACAVLRLFIDSDEIPTNDLCRICESALRGFADPAHAVPVVKVGSLYVAELFHGPTFCFKDLGMRAVIQMLSYFSAKRHRPLGLIVSTTGDTGPAALKAVADEDDDGDTNSDNHHLLSILVHFPKDQISELQRRQLTTVQSSRVRVASFEGSGDDMDRPIKNMLASSASAGPFVDRTSVWTGINSYNIGRPLMQMVHYIWTYLRVMEYENEEAIANAQRHDPQDDGDGSNLVDNDAMNPIFMDVILPTGAMGNIVAGYMAQCMGIPLGQFVAAVNINDMTHRVIQTGQFHRQEHMLKTLSDAINIQVPYNFERLLYYVSGCNHEQIRLWMETMEATQQFDLDPPTLAKLQTHFASARVTDDAMCQTLRNVDETYQYLVDPHTAVAFCAAEQLGYIQTAMSHHGNAVHREEPNLHRGRRRRLAALLSTCKFEESVTAAVGVARWREYYECDRFPTEARALMHRTEQPIVEYTADPTKSLSENQDAWEALARTIMAQLANRA